jgi:16S rRNA (adenine1518-N6/adenine1519-N6)-dimethyltransferase
MREKRNKQPKLLQQYHLRPSKRLGQNFLIDQKVLHKIIGVSDLSENDIVVEIGPGLGILTIELARRVKKVIAVEKDKNLIKALKQVLAENKIENVEIIQGDILKLIPNNQFRIQKKYPKINPQKLDIETWDFFRPPASPCLPASLRPPDMLTQVMRAGKALLAGEALRAGDSNLGIGHYKVIANIPYYLTSPLIRKFLESENPPQAIILMIQKEVAQRICARPPHMSLLSVAVQFYAEPKIISYVSKKSFWPQPKVDSAIIKMTPRNVAGYHPEFISGSRAIPTPSFLSPLLRGRLSGDQSPLLKGRLSGDQFREHFFRVVRAGFSHPRKQLANNLSTELKIDRKKIEEFLEKIWLKSTQRAEELTVDNWRILTVLIVENVV